MLLSPTKVILAVCLGLALSVGAIAGEQSPPAPTSGGDPAPPLKVLFLGDRGHHEPADRAAQITPVLAGRGIRVSYTERADDLNPESLARHDALLIYANIDRITPAQEKALIDYVEGGGAFVPVHCASYCFLNSPRYIALVGAQFLRHGTGEFETRIVDPSHPIMKGFEPFRTWDETYVHHKHNEEGRRVLQVRQEASAEEPWTWVRTQGKGRVFYTAYGHDGRTWQNPGFHDLLERGIRWAVNKGPVRDSRGRVAAGLPKFTYDETADEIPNYLPGRQWGTQGEAIRRMQHPLSPEESMRHLVVPNGFEPKLFAAEPAIAKPICMTWDHRGRLWIAESVDYPNTKHPGTAGRDRIRVCEDTDGDGKADKFTVFAEGLNIPTSLLCADGGVIVLQAPDTLFLKDTDGDGKADVRKVLFTGWGTDDTHAGPSNLRWGFDNWIWGIVGYSGFRGTVGGEPLRAGQTFYRFKPDGSKLEFLRSTNNNSWGVGFSEDGLVFGSTANGCPSVYLPIPNHYYERVRGWSPLVLRNIAVNYQFFPLTDQVRQVDHHGGFTAAAGHALYTARTYPPEYWNQTAFVAEPTGHLVATFTLNRKASDVAAYYGWNLVASDDEWTSPIAAEVGPDGNVWVIDWYNYIVQHNPTPRGFKTGRGNAYETPLRDKVHGRIYRIVYDHARPSTPPSLDPGDAPGLVAALGSDNQFWRMHAQRLLDERGKTDIVPALIERVNDRSVDATGLNAGAIHAMWAMQGLGALDGPDAAAAVAVVAALKHPSAGVRRNAVQVLPRGGRSAEAVLSAGLLTDPDPQVRLAAMLALADLPPSDEAAKAIVDVLRRGLARNDHWLGDAATSAAARNDRAFLKATAATADKAAAQRPGPDVLRIVERVAEHWARGGPVEEVGGLLASLKGGDAAIAEALLRGLARGWPRGRPAKLGREDAEAIKQLALALPSGARGQLVRLVSPWGDPVLAGINAEMAATLLKSAQDESLAESRRVDAAKQLVELQSASDETARTLLGLITPRTPPQLAAGLIDAVASGSAPGAGAAMVEHLSALAPSLRAQAIRALFRRSEWTAVLVDAIDKNQVRLSELVLDQKQALAAHPTTEISRRARRLLQRGGGLPDADRQRVIDQLSAQLRRGGDVAAGKLVFTQQCAKCHRHSGEGGQVGPDLSGVAALPRDELLIHILDPSRSVEGNFVQYTVATTDGRVIGGLLAAETRTTVELLDAEGKRHIVLREDIDEMTASKKSLMPEGFEKQITPAQLNDLLAFLTNRGKYLPLDLRKAATIVSTRGMFYDADSPAERLIFPDWSPKVFEGVPFLLVDPQGSRVPNAILLNGPNGEFPPRMPRSVELPCHAPARAIHFLGGVSGWGFPGGQKGSVSMIVRLHYADGSVEDHPLHNGDEFADYIRVVDVPGSKLAFRLRGGQQVRYLAVHPGKASVIDRIELVKGPDETAPVVMAVTIEGNDGGK
jgi:putative membrane-bound dehydrogenase-like protein